MTKRALAGLQKDMPELEIELGMLGYEFETVSSVDAMLAKMGIPRNSSPDTASKNPYDLYVMEANLGSPDEKTYEPASKVYQHVKEDVEAGKAKFRAVSADADLVERTQKAGIPCCSEMDIFKKLSE